MVEWDNIIDATGNRWRTQWQPSTGGYDAVLSAVANGRELSIGDESPVPSGEYRCIRKNFIKGRVVVDGSILNVSELN